MELPKPTIIKSIIAGLTCGIIFGFGEGLGGKIQIILGLIGTVFIAILSFMYVAGSENIDCYNKKMKKSDYVIRLFPRLISFVLSVIISVAIVSKCILILIK